MSLFSVISQEMNNEQLVIRNYVDDLNTKSQLIVYETQEALFFKEGQALDLFGPGRHTLNTGNVPVIKKIFGSIYGGNTPFPCDIYFINKVAALNFIWGTDSPIDLVDPQFSMLIGVRANGQASVRIKDSRRFVLNVVGMLREYTLDSIKKTVKGLMISSIKECIASAIIEKRIGILEITPHLSEIAQDITVKLNAKVESLGIEVNYFALNSVLASDGDLDTLKKAKNEMLSGMNDANIEAYKMKVLSEARAQARSVEGYTYQDERKFDVLENAAKNESAAGGMIGMGVGLGAGFGIGKEVNKVTDVMTGASTASAPTGSCVCTGCGAEMSPTAKFCANCGQPKPQKKFCTECGAEVGANAKFCASCGSKLQ